MAEIVELAKDKEASTTASFTIAHMQRIISYFMFLTAALKPLYP